jgi:hypothetical protein
LRKATKDVQAQNTVVLSGLKIMDYNFKTLGEFDFIAISLPLKSVIQIEAKMGNTESSRNSATKQLNGGQEFFANNCPFPSSENWNYIKVMCFGQSVQKDICDRCKPFVLSSNFIETNMTQPVAVQIADQFKYIIGGSKCFKGIS